MNRNNLERILIKIFEKFGLQKNHAKISTDALNTSETNVN